jgi:hypothetical protein
VNSLYVPPKPEDKLTPRELQERETLRYEVEKGGEVLGAMADGTFLSISFFYCLLMSLFCASVLPRSFHFFQ